MLGPDWGSLTTPCILRLIGKEWDMMQISKENEHSWLWLGKMNILSFGLGKSIRVMGVWELRPFRSSLQLAFIYFKPSYLFSSPSVLATRYLQSQDFSKHLVRCC